MTEFQKHYQEDGSYKWYQTLVGRYVSDQQYQLLEFLSKNITPDEITYIAPIDDTDTSFAVSKLKLRRILRDNNLEVLFDGALESNSIWKKDWNDANELRNDDPIFIQALPALASYAGITLEQAQHFLLEAKI